MSRVGSKMAIVGGAIMAAFAGLTRVVADVETATRRFNLIFRDMAGSMTKELESISRKTGIGFTTLMQQAATFGAVFADIRSEVSDQSFVKVIRNTMQSIVDLAAIGGISIPEAADRFKSAMTSTGESVDQFGFNLRKANLQLEAQRMGMKQSILTMSEQQKQLLKLNIFMRTTERTGVTFVDMVDTINGQFSIMRSNLLEVAVRLGQLIRVGLVPLLRIMNKILIVLRPVADLLSPIVALLGPLGLGLIIVGSALVIIEKALKAIVWWMGILAGNKIILAILKFGAFWLGRLVWLFGMLKLAASAALMSIAGGIMAIVGVLAIGTAAWRKWQKSMDEADPDRQKWGRNWWGKPVPLPPTKLGPDAARRAPPKPIPGGKTIQYEQTPFGGHRVKAIDDAAAVARRAAAFSPVAVAGAFGAERARQLAFASAGGAQEQSAKSLNNLEQMISQMSDGGEKMKVTLFS
jgi:hypothetical protein